MSLPSEVDKIAKQTGLTGAIKGITEETAGIWVGQFNGIRYDIKEIIRQMSMNDEAMNMSLAHLATIASNTSHNVRLVKIEETLIETNRLLNDRL